LEAQWSPTLLPVVTLLGALVPFVQARDVLHQVTGLRFAPETYRRLTEAVGGQLQEQHHRHGVSLPHPPDWDFTVPPRDGQQFPGTVAYLGLDAFAVPTRGRGGVDWKMLYVGLLYDPGKQHTLYLVDYDFEQLAASLRSYAVALGVAAAETLVALTDGGNGLERVLRQGVSGAVRFVLDWWHLSQKLHDVGGLLHEQDAGAAAAWARAREATLWDQGGAALVTELDQLGCPTTATAAAQERWTEVRNHVWKNRHRTDYPEYRARGWDVGSGPTEAGCKVMAGRVKGAGMRWEKTASAGVAALKALYASGMGLWEAFWAQRQPQAIR
jgi:hypothetical protein